MYCGCCSRLLVGAVLTAAELIVVFAAGLYMPVMFSSQVMVMVQLWGGTAFWQLMFAFAAGTIWASAAPKLCVSYAAICAELHTTARQGVAVGNTSTLATPPLTVMLVD